MHIINKILILGSWLVVLLLVHTSCTNSVDHSERTLKLLPEPAQLTVGKEAFILQDDMIISINAPSLKSAADYLVTILQRATGYKFVVTEEGRGHIQLCIDEKLPHKEGNYTLKVTSNQIHISSANYAGVIAAISTIRQMFPVEIEASTVVWDTVWSIPTVSIIDEPRFAWRGILLDVARHFFSKEEVKELLDVMALYKMNKFHWHLTDDQGWRIEIKKYPLLTEKGAWRTFNDQDRICMSRSKREQNPSLAIPSDKLRIIEGDTLYGGFYTQEDIREIIRYAAVRGIDVIPEIDMPGHMQTAVSLYANVSCFPQKEAPMNISSPVCPGKESALEFCKNVYDEIFRLFPSEYVHLGADEVSKKNWEKCSDCQKRMKVNNLKTEEELQSWFIHQMEQYFNENGKRLIGWDEILQGGVSPTATVMWWQSYEKEVVKKSIAQGNSVILCPNYDFYLNYSEIGQSTRLICESVSLLDSLNESQSKQILGVQGNIWGEFIPSRERMHYMAFPRLLAIAETGWSQAANYNWKSFQRRMTGQFNRLDALGIDYRMADLEGFCNTNTFIGETKVNVISPDPDVVIHYTDDGTEPTEKSAVYTTPISIRDSASFAFRAYRPNGKSSKVFHASYKKQNGYIPAVDIKAPKKKGLMLTWYEGDIPSCQVIENYHLKEKRTIDDIYIPSEVGNSKVGLIFTGYFYVSVDGIYSFSLSSDEGSTLKVDEEMIIDNGGRHLRNEVSSQRALAKGWHPLEVRYFDFNGGCLSLKMHDASGKQIKPIYNH